MAEPVEMSFGCRRVGPGNHILDGVNGRHLANTVERSMLVGNAAAAIVTVATGFHMCKLVQLLQKCCENVSVMMSGIW